ncbi:MAG: hypothetical protein J6P84_00430 [Alphaproteobacteria bacterium]|nr:hypothetical protein [Alphaproteobacteria bacterium]MBO7642226.1 hypothetical protein [Alphaproteobacteria bacterium]MCR4623220.1 hypothetical protein [Alphaproteobacteria bacterium]
MKRSNLKELLIFTLWLLVGGFGYFFLAKHYGVAIQKIFYLSVAVIFETYMFFQLPGAEYFCDAAKYAENPSHGKIRLMVMSCLVAFLIFVFKWAYFSEFYFIATIRIDVIINFFRVSHEERHQILEKEGIPELKTYLYILVVAPIILVLVVAAFLWYIFHTPVKSSGGKTQTVSFYQLEDSKPFQNNTLL